MKILGPFVDPSHALLVWRIISYVDVWYYSGRRALLVLCTVSTSTPHEKLGTVTEKARAVHETALYHLHNGWLSRGGRLRRIKAGAELTEAEVENSA